MMETDNITLKDIKGLKKEIAKLKTIGDWKLTVAVFRDEHKLTDKQAIRIANMEISDDI